MGRVFQFHAHTRECNNVCIHHSMSGLFFTLLSFNYAKTSYYHPRLQFTLDTHFRITDVSWTLYLTNHHRLSLFYDISSKSYFKGEIFHDLSGRYLKGAANRKRITSDKSLDMYGHCRKVCHENMDEARHLVVSSDITCVGHSFL